jgi:hypothetical protein
VLEPVVLVSVGQLNDKINMVLFYFLDGFHSLSSAPRIEITLDLCYREFQDDISESSVPTCTILTELYLS